MRSLFSKALTGSMIASAALLVSACGGSENTTENTMITDLNTTEGMDTMTDNMTAVDGAMNGGMMANDTMAPMGNDMMSNGSMMSNDTMTSNTMTNAM